MKKIVEQAQSYFNEIHSLQDGDPAPDFSAITINNKKIDLSELRGKVMLIEFWSTTCGPCIKELPNLKEIYGLNKDNKDFVMIGVSLDTEIEKVNSFIEINDLKWHQIFDDGYGEISQLYNAVYIPRTYLIDRDGNIAHKDLRENDLKNAVSSMLIN
ncbi:MAG: TlpA family protein disulfide reductase [bacterium]|nr:TlpA family protein disulfide reductase [bacterium]